MRVYCNDDKNDNTDDRIDTTKRTVPDNPKIQMIGKEEV